MFNPRGGFAGQRPMGAPRMNQPGIGGHHGMNMPGMNMPNMNMTNMGMSNMNQPNLNLSGMNQSGMNLGMNRMGSLGMNTNVGLPPLNPPPPINVYRMGGSATNQGGMGYQTDMKSQGFNMRPMDSPGSFLGGTSDSMGMKSMPLRPPIHVAPPPIPQHFTTPPVPITQAQPRMGSQSQEMPSNTFNRVLTQSSDHLLGKVNTLQETAHMMKEKLGAFGNLNQDLGMKSGPLSSLDPVPNAQNRYTSESASSILESFGLSNEDLEELSRYPDDQLTPLNLPNILRDIRLRKVNRSGAGHDQGGAGRRSGGEVVASKVIDYGHSSKYQIGDKPSSRPFESSRSNQKSSASKQPAPSKSSKTEKTKSSPMDNKIPTISVSRKQTSWQGTKVNSSNNKTLVGESIPTVTNASVKVTTAESPVITIKPEPTPLSDIPVDSSSSMTNSNAPVETAVGQGIFLPSTEAATSGNANWGSTQTQEDQKSKKLPTPSMMNDYFASSPRIFPHICSLCNVECRHLKDWIKHQNNTSHIESCRKLRQQYPEWNPQVQTCSAEGKNEEAKPKGSRSKSGSPRRGRRSGSRHRTRRSRSRSPKPTARRSRSRSPRRSGNIPGKSHSPHRGTRSPRHSQSPRRRRRERSSTPPDKKAVDAAVQSFIESSKLKSGDKSRASKSSSDGKKPPSGAKKSNSPPKHSSSSSTAKKPTSSSRSNSSKKPTTSSSSIPAKKPTTSSSSTSNANVRKPSTGGNTKKPPASTSTTAKKPVVSTGAKKTTPGTSFTKKTHPGKPTAPAKPFAPEPCNPLNKLTSKGSSQNIIHVTDLPDSGYTDQDILKIVQPFGKVCDILIVRSKNEAFVETNFREAATAAIKFSETAPVMINNKRVTLSLAGQNKEKKPEPKVPSELEPKNKLPPQPVTSSKKPVEKKKQPDPKKGKSPEIIVIPPGFVKSYALTDPPLKDSEKCVVEISNLPEKQSSVEEISNLAKPFGGVKDVLVISPHRKAFLELNNRNSVDSMLKFYDAFPVYLGGSLLKIAMSTKYKNVEDENRIFTEIIQQSPFKINPTIYQNFVHLANLPENDYEDFDITKLGLRFGKVEHYMVIRNKRKAILHMNKASSAKAMFSFLDQYPSSIAGSSLKCTLAKKTKLAENEYMTYLEEEVKKSTESDDVVIVGDYMINVDEEGKKSTGSDDVIIVEEHVALASNEVKEHTDKQDTQQDAPQDVQVIEQQDAPQNGQLDVQAKEQLDVQAKEQLDVQAKEQLDGQAKEQLDGQQDKKQDGQQDKKQDGQQDKKQDGQQNRQTDGLSNGQQDQQQNGQLDGQQDSQQDKQSTQVNAPTEGSAIEVEAAEGGLATSSSVVSQQEDCDNHDDDDEEEQEEEEEEEEEDGEAAVAPEGPEVPFVFVQPEPVIPKESSVALQVYVSEESDVLVSVESDEEECEEQLPITQTVTPPAEPAPAAGESEIQDGDMEECPNDIPCDLELDSAENAHNSSTQGLEAEKSEDSDSAVEATEVSGNACEAIVKEEPDGSAAASSSLEKTSSNTENGDKGSKSSSTSKRGTSKQFDKSKDGKERPRHSSHSRNKDDAVDVKKTDPSSSGSSLTRTAKYNPQKGDLCVTVTVDKSRKRPSGDRGSSGRDGSTPKSSSSRSSPSDNSTGNPKGMSHQTKGNTRGATSQDSKGSSRSRESESRSSSSRKDDRSKSSSVSSSSRYTRSSKGSSRGPKSVEEEDTFPFNLDEFVTVDEIVEDNKDDDEQQSSPIASTPRRGKRKESHPAATPDAKKAKGAVERSFVTLDEVGDDDENANTAETSQVQEDQTPQTADEDHAKDDPSTETKVSEILVTLDEVSDDEEALATPKEPCTPVMPDMLGKDQLLTLDEVHAEDEQTSHSEPSNPESQPHQEGENKEEKVSSDPEVKETIEAATAPSTAAALEAPSEQPLDEVKDRDEEDDDDSIGDIEHKFLTVDEIGEDEEDTEVKEEKSSPTGRAGKKTKVKPSKQAVKTPTGKRGRPRKRPLPDPSDDSKDTKTQTPATEPVKTPVKTKASRGSSKGEESTTPNKSEADDTPSKTEPPAKMTKLESPASDQAKLGPFNSTVAVGMEFLVPKTGYFCELCSLFYMDDAAKLKHCKSLRHYQAVQKHVAKEEESAQN